MSKLDLYFYRIFQENGAPEETPPSIENLDFSDSGIRRALTPGPGTVAERLVQLEKNTQQLVANIPDRLSFTAWTDTGLRIQQISQEIRTQISTSTR